MFLFFPNLIVRHKTLEFPPHFRFSELQTVIFIFVVCQGFSYLFKKDAVAVLSLKTFS